MTVPFSPRVLGLILARGGSKRLPFKNQKLLGGKPLVAWSIEASLACRSIGQTVVSTDSPAIAEIAVQYGASVPFLRPAALAQDASTSADAALHALDFLRDHLNQEFDAVMLLEPTSPLRAKRDVSGVLELLARRWGEVDAVVTVGRVHLEQPSIMKILRADGFLAPWEQPRGDGSSKPEAVAWFPYGVGYAVKVSALRQHRSFYPPRVLGFALERWQNYEVDDECDFVCVEALINRLKDKMV